MAQVNVWRLQTARQRGLELVLLFEGGFLRTVLFKIRQPDEEVSTFAFQPRWKEELVCTGPGGSFVLELPMGHLTAYLPTEEAWKLKSPQWSRDLWSVLKVELEAWCEANHAIFVIDVTAAVY